MDSRIVYECRHCGSMFQTALGGARTEARYCGQNCYKAAIATPEARAYRFWAKVDKNGPVGIHSQTGIDLGPCWLWMGARDGNGYGNVRVSKRYRRAHIVSFELVRGPVQPGLVLDHLCRTSNCVNPCHLEPVTQRVNLHRGTGPVAVNARKTHCVRGHSLSGTNTYVAYGPSGPKRRCRACHRNDMAARRSVSA